MTQPPAKLLPLGRSVSPVPKARNFYRAWFDGKDELDKSHASLRLLVEAAARDAEAMMHHDPHLHALFREVFSEGGDVTLIDIDAYVDQAIVDYMKRRKNSKAVRGAKVRAITAISRQRKLARATAEVRAWGHMVRVVIDIQLPQ